jgi:hypothetical protein
LIGGGTILAATAGMGAFLTTRTPHKALAPWSLAGTYDEPRMRALSYAILAPNPHNRQPWLVDLNKPYRITLYVDPEKDLPETDPFDRQITIGLGCFLELLRMALAEEGLHAEITPFPEGVNEHKLDRRPVAVIALTNDRTLAREGLFTQVLARRSYKESFDVTRPVAPHVLKTLIASAGPGVTAGGSVDEAALAPLRRLTHEALRLELHTPRTYQESLEVLRIGKAEIEANPDGVDIGGPMMELLKLFGMLTPEVVRNPEHFSTKPVLEGMLEPFSTQMGFIWLVTQGNTRVDQLNAGRDWLRVNLAATGAGLGLRPVSQALQEYAEMEALLAETHARLAPDGGRVQMLGQLGYPLMDIPPAPRWAIEAKLLGS